MTISIGERIKALREEQGLSQWALAKASGLKQPFISKVEQGTKKPSPESLDKIADALESTGENLVVGTECEGAYFAAHLSAEENRKRTEYKKSEHLRQQAVLLNVLSAWYDRARRLFTIIHEGSFCTSSSDIENVYQHLLNTIQEKIQRIIEFIPDIEEYIHLPETTDIDVRAGGVENMMKGVEAEGLWEYVDQPAMAKTVLYLRKLRALNPACAPYDLETLVTDRDELAKPLYDLDDWLTEFRARKLAQDKRLMDRMIEQAKSHQS